MTQRSHDAKNSRNSKGPKSSSNPRNAQTERNRKYANSSRRGAQDSRRAKAPLRAKKTGGLSQRPLREDLVTQACLEAYGAVRHEGRLSNLALEHVLRSRKHLYANERRAVAERVYALLRRQRLVDFLVDRAWPRAQGLSVTERDLFRLVVSRVLEGEATAAVADSVGWRGAEASRLAQVMAHREALHDLPEAERFAVEHSLPDFFAAKLRDELGAEAASAAEAMNTRAPLTVRVNVLKTTRAALKQALLVAGVQVTDTRYSPLGLVLETRVNVYSLEAFKEGLFEVQDEGSQLLGMLVDAPPRRCIDACAGAGGKALQLAAQMKNRGELFALDIEARRLTDLKLRARRAGVHNCRIATIAASSPAAEESLSPYLDSAERVLVDAPCSGSGTFRRKPDARYKLDAQRLSEHVERQKVLLARFAALVKPGGRLIYGTCSVLREENEAVVSDFLSKHPNFALAPAGQWLGEVGSELTVDGMLRLYPHRHGTDGFFGAVLQREAARP